MSLQCSDCGFKAASARQLSRHKAINHTKNSLQCQLCPFVTAYQTNLARHRRDVHGIVGAKGCKSCKYCGFSAPDTQGVIVHQAQAHTDILQTARNKFAKEKANASGQKAKDTKSKKKIVARLSNPTTSNWSNPSQSAQSRNQNRTGNDSDDEQDFWKEGFLDEAPNFLLELAHAAEIYDKQHLSEAHQKELEEEEEEEEDNDFSSSLDEEKIKDDNEEERMEGDEADGENDSDSPQSVMNITTLEEADDASNDETRNSQMQRQYSCTDCLYVTQNAREFLYHRRDSHGQSVQIVECPSCIYACQDFEKLQRHLLKVHKLATSMTPPPEVMNLSKRKQAAQSFNKQAMKVNSPAVTLRRPDSKPKKLLPPLKVKLNLAAIKSLSGLKDPTPQIPLKRPKKVESESEHKFSSKKHDKTKHPKSSEGDRQYICKHCDFTTENMMIFRNHIQLKHSVPRFKCNRCEFRTYIRGNLDSHMKTHKPIEQRLFKCNKCGFTCIRQEQLSVHTQFKHPQKSVQASSSKALPLQKPKVSSRPSYPTLKCIRLPDGRVSITQERRASTSSSSSGSKPPTKQSSLNDDSLSSTCIECPQCEFNSDTVQSMQRHLVEAHYEHADTRNMVNMLGKYQSSIDGKKHNSFRLAPPRQRKLRIASSDTDISAKHSGFKTKNLTSTSRSKPYSHQKSHIPGARAFQCSSCHEKYRTSEDLEQHMIDFHHISSGHDLLRNIDIDTSDESDGEIEEIIMEPEDERLPDDYEEAPLVFDDDDEDSTESKSKENDNVTQGDASDGSERRSQEFDEIKMEPEEDRLPEDYEEAPLIFDEPSEEEEEAEAENGIDDDDDPDENRLLIVEEERDHVKTTSKAENNLPSDQASLSNRKIKMYQCNRCQFVCPTPSRFHDHYLGHINTKPYQCSACELRSNAQRNIERHIKNTRAKGQEDHEIATVTLVHESGKKQYSKYDKYVVWMSEKEAAEINANRIDSIREFPEAPPLKKFKTEDEMSYADDSSNLNFENNVDPESIMITPEILLTVEQEEEDREPPHDGLGTQTPKAGRPKIPPNAAFFSNQTPKIGADGAKLLTCCYCGYACKESKSMVSHLSQTHAGRKPYYCGNCGFSSNWKEVVVRHAVARHSGDSRMVEQRFRFSVSKFMCKLVDAHGNPLTLKSFEPEKQLPEYAGDFTPQLVQQMSRIDQGGVKLSGLKGALQCKFCPFRASRPFHMEFHAKHHKPQEGATFQCKKCPFWVNSKKSLLKHLMVHDHFEKAEEEEDNENEDGMSNGSFEEVPNQEDKRHPPEQEEEVEEYRCPSCPFIGRNKAQLEFHRQFHRENPSAQFRCDKCSYAVAYEHLLNQHARVHEPTHGNDETANGTT